MSSDDKNRHKNDKSSLIFFVNEMYLYLAVRSTMLDVLLSIILIAINIYILVYLVRLERMGCQCAMDFRRVYVIAYLIASIVYAALVTGAFVASTRWSLPEWVTISGNVLSLVMLIAGILYIVFGIQYINRLREEKCACSNAVARDVWEVVLYIHVAYLILAALLILLVYAAFAMRLAGREAEIAANSNAAANANPRTHSPGAVASKKATARQEKK